MCGIAGAVDLKGDREFPLERLLAMTSALAHRGPDDEHVHLEPGLALGARRLAIVDLGGGRQPIANERGDVWVAFNGELFDYPELQRQLESRGHRLATRCDTELWVHLYEDFGEELFEHAQGQFALALWDRSRRTLLLARDRVGICPLFYARHDDWLLFGSEIKSLLASGLIEAVPDPKGINHFFTNFGAASTRTCFKGIKPVPPGHCLKIREGNIALRQYWDLDFPDAGDEQRYADVQVPIDELEDLLRRAVRRRLRGDVPVVSYLSGGLDSTLLLQLASQERGQALHSFTIGLDRAGPDERAKSSRSAKLLDSRHTMVTMGRDQIAPAFPELIRAAEAPALDTTAACVLRLAEAVHRDGYKVVLTGEGADEALAGYYWFKWQKLSRQMARATGRGLPNSVQDVLLASIGGARVHRPLPAAVGGVRTAQQGISEMIAQSRESLYTADMWDRLDGHSPYDDLVVSDRIARWHPLNQSLYVGYKVMLPGMLLMARGDRAAMNSSVETRYPFLDEDVIRFCAALDPMYKLKGLTGKWLLRRVAARVLPAAIARRPKRMFLATLSKTFLSPNSPPWVDQLLSPESLLSTGYFNPTAVTSARKTLTRAPRFTPRRYSLDRGLMAVIATQLWHHTYCGGNLADLPTWSPKAR